MKLTYKFRQRKQTRNAKLKRENTSCFLDFVDVSFDVDVCLIACPIASMVEMGNGKLLAL